MLGTGLRGPLVDNCGGHADLAFYPVRLENLVHVEVLSFEVFVFSIDVLQLSQFQICLEKLQIAAF